MLTLIGGIAIILTVLPVASFMIGGCLEVTPAMVVSIVALVSYSLHCYIHYIVVILPMFVVIFPIS